MNSLIDTGFLLAVLDKNDHRHFGCVNALESEFSPLLPEVVLSELAYLVLRELGYKVWVSFLRSVANGELPLISATTKDLARSAEILEKYQDSKIDFVDSIIMAIAERLEITRILTVDRRDFGLFRPQHCAAFEIVP